MTEEGKPEPSAAEQRNEGENADPDLSVPEAHDPTMPHREITKTLFDDKSEQKGNHKAQRKSTGGPREGD
jgi:hypothetical protein